MNTGVAMQGRYRQRGFTLVELLLSVTLMALLLGLAYGGLTAATKSSSRGQALLEETGRLRLTHQFIRRQLNQMLPLPYGLDEDDGLTQMFEGSDRFVQYVAPMPGYLGSGGPHVQRLEFVDGNDGLELWFRHALTQEFEPAMLDEQEPVVLLTGLEWAQFEYLQVVEPGEEGEWLSHWDTSDSLPTVVRLDIDFGESSQLTWPVLATGVRVDPSALAHTGLGDRPMSIREMMEQRHTRDDNE